MFKQVLGLGLPFSNVCAGNINEIGDLYQEFIINYNRLNKVFDLNDPIQISTMFNYLLYKGYLSVGKRFEFLDQKIWDVDGLDGVNVIVGKAVCRHISAILGDILNNYGIESFQLFVYSMGYRVDVTIIEQQKYTKEELVSWVQTHIIDEQTYEFLINVIEDFIDKKNENIELSAKVIENKNILDRIFGNHVITFSVKDGKSYYLDPTRARIYRTSEDDKNILYDDEFASISIRLLQSIVLNDFKTYLKMRENLVKRYSNITSEVEQRMVMDTIMKCNNNEDIFEQFYNENRELYDSISNKVLRIIRK